MTMSERQLSILVAAKGALRAAQQIGLVDKKVDKLGKTSSRVGKLALAGGVAAFGAAAFGVQRAVRGGIESLAELEDATTQVDGAIQQVGSNLTSGQIAQWANEVEANVQAAFDDKEIVSATGTLIRYGKVADKNVQPAIQVMTDLAAKTGSVESASTLLSKALADPAKAAGKLARVGVVLTKEQQKQIKAMVKAGDTAGAQALLLDALAETTKGAAAASAGPYRDSLNILSDTWEDARRALAEGFLPVIMKVSDILRTELAKPETIAKIKEFGKGLAGGLDKLIDTARGLPWGTIGDSLKLAGQGAKAVFDAFTAMPSWVQSAVLTGWGLNKLTGGALSAIVGELGKGLIKGVLGITAGVVNIKAGTVVGGGAGPGATAPTGGGIAHTIGAGIAVGVVIEGIREGVNLLGPIQGLFNNDSSALGQLESVLKDTFLLPQWAKDILQEQIDQTSMLAAQKQSAAAIAQQEKSADAQLRNRMEANRIATQTGTSAIVTAVRGIKLNPSFYVSVNGLGARRVASGGTTRTGGTLVRTGFSGGGGHTEFDV